MNNQNYGESALSKDVAEKFEVIDWVGSHRQFFGTFGIIDLSTMTLQQAERLAKLNFPKIRRKSNKQESAQALKAK